MRNEKFVWKASLFRFEGSPSRTLFQWIEKHPCFKAVIYAATITRTLEVRRRCNTAKATNKKPVARFVSEKRFASRCIAFHVNWLFNHLSARRIVATFEFCNCTGNLETNPFLVMLRLRIKRKKFFPFGCSLRFSEIPTNLIWKELSQNSGISISNSFTVPLFVTEIKPSTENAYHRRWNVKRISKMPTRVTISILISNHASTRA